jgi:hypothetical protein
MSFISQLSDLRIVRDTSSAEIPCRKELTVLSRNYCVRTFAKVTAIKTK